MKKLYFVCVILVLSFVLFGCSSTVQRIDTSTIKDLSGRWNDADAQLVAEQIVDDMLNGGWLKKWTKKTGREPRVIVGTIKNKTDEHIEIDVFRKDIEKELTNSGEVVFVASKEEREEIRDERTDMQEYASEETKKKFKKETAADFMMKGVLTSVIDEKGGEKIVYYQCDIELFDLETNAKVWVGQKKIKKLISKPGLGL
jgi:uncharacterized protein (TIGR02722 family)